MTRTVQIKSFNLLLSLASTPPYMVLPYLLPPPPPFKCSRTFHLKMKECWFCKTPLSQNWGGHFCPAESEEKSPSRRFSIGSAMQKCLSARLEDASTILIRWGERLQVESIFTNLPHLISRTGQTHADRWIQVLCVREGLITLFQYSLTDLCFELDLADVWECLGFLPSRPTGTHRSKPHLSLSNCFNFIKIRTGKKNRGPAHFAKVWNRSGLLARGENGDTSVVLESVNGDVMRGAWKPSP